MGYASCWFDRSGRACGICEVHQLFVKQMHDVSYQRGGGSHPFQLADDVAAPYHPVGILEVHGDDVAEAFSNVPPHPLDGLYLRVCIPNAELVGVQTRECVHTTLLTSLVKASPTAIGLMPPWGLGMQWRFEWKKSSSMSSGLLMNRLTTSTTFAAPQLFQEFGGHS